MLETYQTFTDESIDAFPRQIILQAVSMQGRAKNYVPTLVRYGISRARGRYLVKHNALKAKNFWADHDLLVIGAAQEGALMGFEMLQPWGDPNPAIETARRAGMAAGKEITTLDVYPTDLKAIR